MTQSHIAIRQNTDPVPSETSKHLIFQAIDRSVFFTVTTTDLKN